MGLFLVYRHLPDCRAEHTDKLDWVGLLLFGTGVALLSYVLEIFGDHTLSAWEICVLLVSATGLLLSYGWHALRAAHPLLRLGLLRIRTLRVAVIGSFVTRLGIGGMPFLLPLLYQVGLGYSPIQSGLLILPQSVAAISLKATMPMVLRRFGYRRVLLINTVLLGLLIVLFATIGQRTSALAICLQALTFGFLSSLQFTSMNTLVYADVTEADTSMASTIASTMQQMSTSFGVAAASLTTAVFIPNRFRSDPREMIHGIHLAFLVLGGLTVVSAAIFRKLRQEDGDRVSRHKMAPAVI